MKRTLLLTLGLFALTPLTAMADSNATGGNVLNSESVFLGAGPFAHGAGVGSADNSTTTAAFTGGFNANRIRFSGTNTSVLAATWADEAAIVITTPNIFVPESFQWTNGSTVATYTTFDFDRAVEFDAAFNGGAGVIDPSGTWGVEFIDLINDGAGADSESTNVTMTFEESVPVSDSNGVFSLGAIGNGDSVSSVGELALPALFDSYTFSLASDGTLNAFTEFQNVFTGNSIDTEIALFDGAGNLIAEDDDSGAGTYSAFNDLSLTAGDYTLVVAGYNSAFADGFSVTPGNAVGDYGLTVSFAAAVPEPTSASILALGAMGLAFVRRRKS